ncbi:MAG TPA: hypothetical protein VG318_16845 [Actinomycetota bacterium]|nr:hypothetical protein [Actinomycetota bacterium]
MLLSVLTVVLPNALAIAQGGCSRVTRSGHWVTADVQEFASGGPITDYEIVAINSQTIFVTDGTDVLRTSNGGCTWRKVFSVTGTTPLDYGFRGDASEILSIDLPRTGGTTVLLAVEEQVGATSRPHVVRGENLGESWESGDVGLPPTGRPEALVISPINPEIAYLGVDVGGGSLDLIFRSEDGGATWRLRSDLTKVAPNRGIDDFKVDPMKPEELWAYGPGGLLKSTDGGATFTPIDEFLTSIVREVLVFHAPSRTNPVVLAFRQGANDYLTSADGGENWSRTDTPGTVESAAYGRQPLELMIQTYRALHVLNAASGTWIRVLTPRAGIVDLDSDLGVDVTFFGRTAGTIEMYDGPTGVKIPPAVRGGPDIDVPGLIPDKDAIPPAPPALGPPDAKVVMKTGAERSVDYRLKLSRETTKLDVFFLLDTSDTMSGTIQGLAQSVTGIINELRAQGLDAQFGIGVSRAYTDTAVPREPCQSETDTNCERNFIYRRLVDLADDSNSDEIIAALESLRAEAGGRFDSQLGALEQIAKGNGIDDSPQPGYTESDVPPGQEATFRGGEDTLRLVFVATDEPFATGEGGARDFNVSDFGRISPPDIPSFAEVAEAFKVRDAHVLGLAIGQTLEQGRDTVGGGPTPLDHLREIARLTGAKAPAGGVDCDGDGAVDLEVGVELVCPVRRNNVDNGQNLAAAITKLVQAVRGTTSVELDVVKGAEVVAGIEPGAYPSVVLQQPNVLDYEVTYRCPNRLQGEKVTVELAAKTPAATLDSVTTTISCLEEKVEEPPLLPIDPISFVAILPPIMPPAPPPIVEIAPGAQGQAQAQSQAQAQGAMASQEQEQPQLAYVAAMVDPREALEEELALSDRRRSEVPQWATLGAGAAMMSLAYGWLVVSRQRNVRVQRVRRY